MSGSRIPDEAPPSYSQATGSSQASNPAQSAAGSSSNTNASSHLNVPGASAGGKDGIPTAYRRSMEDEQRPLPKGWVRTYDPNSEHQFFVDTTKEPPRSIWHHPYDDDEYLATLPTEERERIEQESMSDMLGNGNHGSKEHMIHSHSDDEDDHQHAAAGSSAAGSSAQLPPRPEGKGKQPERSFGRKLKDKVTGMTHEQREQERKRRAEEEQRMYEQHLRVRQAMTKAMQTGQPQLLGKDRDGKVCNTPSILAAYTRNGITDTSIGRLHRASCSAARLPRRRLRKWLRLQPISATSRRLQHTECTLHSPAGTLRTTRVRLWWRLRTRRYGLRHASCFGWWSAWWSAARRHVILSLTTLPTPVRGLPARLTNDDGPRRV